MNLIQKLSEKEYIDQKPGLNRIKKILKIFNNPQDSFCVIHITGTNGKGTVAMSLHNILKQTNNKIGLYISPHILKLQERIKVNNEFIPVYTLEKLFQDILKLDERYKIGLTYFEILTAVAFLHFKYEKVNFCILEVGLGGKYDATNVVRNTLVSIITHIDYDHTELFGKSLKKITLEKTGIIKKNSSVIINSQYQIVENIIKNICRKNNCTLFEFNKKFTFKNQKLIFMKNKYYQIFDYYGLMDNYKNLCVSAIGKNQLANISLTLAATELLKNSLNIKTENIYYGLKNLYLPARFEYREVFYENRKYKFIIDGAHNPDSINNLKNNLYSIYGKNKKFTFILNFMREKNYKKICAILSKLTKNLIIYNLMLKRVIDQNILKNEFLKYLKNQQITTLNSFKELLKKIKEINDKFYIVTGSFYLAGEILKKIKKYETKIN